MVGVDSDKLVTKADSTENLTVENSTAKNFATAGIRVDYDIFVVVENYYENFVDCLCQILLQLCALAIGTHISGNRTFISSEIWASRCCEITSLTPFGWS